jgi:hypothetical protein
MRHARIKALTSTFTSTLDIYLTKGLRSSRSQRAPKAGSSRGRFVLWGVLCLSAVGIAEADAKQISTTDMYKLYAHSRIINDKEYYCFIKLINKENRSWDVRARNGSHYGLGQMRSTWYRDLDGYRQIDATLSYITKRYTTVCKAWYFHTQRNYY